MISILHDSMLGRYGLATSDIGQATLAHDHLHRNGGRQKEDSWPNHKVYLVRITKISMLALITRIL